jgi:hypothetical protein
MEEENRFDNLCDPFVQPKPVEAMISHSALPSQKGDLGLDSGRLLFT